MTEITLNQNAVTCLKTISDVGKDTIVNVCTGQENVIPWGSMKWIDFYSGIGFAALISGLFLATLIMFIKWIVFDD